MNSLMPFLASIIEGCRVARYVESAWHSCGVVAHLYPEKSTDIANFLIAFSRRLRSES